MVLSFSTSPSRKDEQTIDTDSTSTHPHLPHFTGEKPVQWIHQTEVFFQFYGIYEDERFPYVIEAFDDEPFYWFNSWFRSGRLTWNDFTKAMLHRFHTTTASGNRIQPPPSFPAQPPSITSFHPVPKTVPSPNSIPAPPTTIPTPAHNSSRKELTHRDLAFVDYTYKPFYVFHTRHDHRDLVWSPSSYYFYGELHHPYVTTSTTKLLGGEVGRREWRPPWQSPCRFVETKPNATGRHEWRPAWRVESVLEDKDVFRGVGMIRAQYPGSTSHTSLTSWTI